MVITAISDLHGYLPTIEPTDILCICGDIFPLDIQRNYIESEEWFYTKFKEWIDSLDVDLVVLIAGNHDFYEMKKFYNGSKELQNLNNEFKNKLVYLQDSLYTYKDGTTIYGCPWCTQFGHWAFMGDHELITAKYKMIPDNVDIILCHQPPFGYGDVGTILEGNKGDVGSTELASRLNDIQFKWLFCGHIHSGNHTPYDTGHGKVVNVSYVNEHYYPWYKAFTI